ncbi:tetratricopeptide repeat protein [Lysobacter sp. A289]
MIAGDRRGTLFWGAALLIGLVAVVHAEIVPVTPPLVPAAPQIPESPETAVGTSSMVSTAGMGAEIVPPRPKPVGAAPTAAGEVAPSPDLALPAPPSSSNIVWPSNPAGIEPASDDSAVVMDTPGVEGGAVMPMEAAAEVVAGSDDPLQQALAAYRGDADPRSYAEAARWFKVAADAGDRRAAMAFAYLQGLGLGVARDPAAARRSLQQISAAGVARADYLLSLLFAAERRRGGEKQQAALRERAARGGDGVAQNAMGVHYQLQGDRTTAQMWYQRAVDNGSAAAKLNLASLARGDEARRQVEAGAEAAADGDAESLYALARRYHRGDGVPVDYGKALRLYRDAAAQGSKPALQMLGLIQARTLPGGGFDPTWMRQLASAAVGQSGGNLVSNITSAAQPRLDDPLAGLSDLGL